MLNADLLPEAPREWVLAHCAELCHASYEDNPVAPFSGEVFHDIKGLSVSTSSPTNCGLLIADAKHPRFPDYVFICFRGTKTWEDVVADSKLWATPSGCGAVHAGFLQRSTAIPVEALVGRNLMNKQIVVTGHSLGGAAATLLACQMFVKYPHPAHRLKKRLLCVTFGAPLIGTASLADTMRAQSDRFHHYAHPNDIVPKLLVKVPELLASALVKAMNWCPVVTPLGLDAALPVVRAFMLPSFKPFGQFYLMQSIFAWQLKQEEVLKHINSCPETVSPDHVSDHMMEKYRKTLYDTFVDSKELPPCRWEKPPPASSLVPPIGVASATCDSTHLRLTGKGLRFAKRAFINGQGFDVKSASDTVLVLLANMESGTIKVRIMSLFGPSEEFTVPCQSTVNRLDMIEGQVAAATTPRKRLGFFSSKL